MKLKSINRLAITLFSILILVTVAGLQPLAAFAGSPTQQGDFEANEVVIKFANPTTSPGAAAAVKTMGLPGFSTLFGWGEPSVDQIDKSGQTFSLGFPQQIDVKEYASIMSRQPGVDYAEPNYVMKTSLMPNDELASSQWALQQIQADKAWDITTGSDAMTIALLDTGVDPGHPDLQGKLLPGYNFVSENGDTSDDEGHGTFTAGLAAASTNNSIGIAGVSWNSKILPVKIFDDQGRGPSSNFAKGIYFATDNGARVISISAGVDYDTGLMADAVKYAYSKGVVMVAAAGNTPDGNPSYPAGYDQVIAVGATGRGDNYTGFSSYGSYVDVTAPGAGILSTIWEEGKHTYAWENGTSASCPLVAGVAALVLAVKPDLTNEQVKQIIEGSADDLGPVGWDEHYGAGRVNAFRAVQAARDGNLTIGHQSIINGAVSGIEPSKVQVQLNGGQSVQPDAAGNFQFANLGPGSYTITASADGRRNPEPVQVSVNGSASDVKNVQLEFQAGVASAFVPLPWMPDSATSLYFPETGHTLSMGFKAYWEKNGGLPVFGFPVSEEFTEVSPTDGKSYTVQYFERNRFEYHPEFAGTRYEVLLGLLGSEATKDQTFPNIDEASTPAGGLYFEETRNSLSGPFLDYWTQHGGLLIFGYPISEPFEENGYLVQYFERNRFEYHPELPAAYHVSLGLLGNDLARKHGYMP
jgi:subtilisin family serine protease